jgi:SAM-dependent MidA family methyltransferase
MSYHAPHTLSPSELEELEQSESPEGAVAVPAVAEAVKQTMWVVYDYDHQTTQYAHPLTAYTTKAAALAHRAESGWLGVHKLDVWQSVEDWKAAGKPTFSD